MASKAVTWQEFVDRAAAQFQVGVLASGLVAEDPDRVDHEVAMMLYDWRDGGRVVYDDCRGRWHGTGLSDGQLDAIFSEVWPDHTRPT